MRPVIGMSGASRALHGMRLREVKGAETWTGPKPPRSAA